MIDNQDQDNRLPLHPIPTPSQPHTSRSDPERHWHAHHTAAGCATGVQEAYLLPQVPQCRGVVFQPLQSVLGHLTHALESTPGLPGGAKEVVHDVGRELHGAHNRDV